MNSGAGNLQRPLAVERGLDWVRSMPAIRRRTLRRRLRTVLIQYGAMVQSIAVKHGSDSQSPWLVRVQTKGRRVVVTIAPGVERLRQFWYLFDRLPGVLYLARLAERSFEFDADMSDGHMGFEKVLGFCSNRDSVCLAPDPDFFNSRGYASLRQQASPDWRDRSSDILWRGSPNGQGAISHAAMDPDDTSLIQRVRMCLMLRNERGVDARLVISDRTAHLEPEDALRLQQAGIAGQAVAQAEWWRRRFAIDVDGYTNAWSGLFTHLLMGCCVLKVASPTGHRQWYYPRLEPWQHYIPVKDDLSDLHQQFDWCRAHAKECERIARRGRELALAMDFDTEFRQAAESLAQHLAAHCTFD